MLKHMIMKRFVKLAACMLGVAATLLSCERNGSVSQTTFEMQVVNNNNQILVTVVPSDENASYCTGIIMEDDWKNIGGAEGLTAYIDSVAGAGTTISVGATNNRYEDLFWQTKYYAFAAQINDGKVYGSPEWKEILIYRPYVEFAPKDLTIAPVAVSDNGIWIVGNYNGEGPTSYIYDVRRDSLTIVTGALFYDVTNDGVAYGRDMMVPVIWKDGELTQVPVSGNMMECGFYGVTPDGAIAVGYAMDNEWKNKALLYENGAVSYLPATDLSDKDPAGVVAKGIGSNGNISGYLQDFDTYFEVGCAWTGASHEYDFYAKEFMEWNQECLEGGGAYENKYGDVEVRISPNGRYYAGRVTVSDETWEQPVFAYVFDSQDRKMYQISDKTYDGWRPDAVSSTGLVFLSDVDMGISSQPYVYDPIANTVKTFADYAKSEYGYIPDGFTIQGSVVSVSEDACTVVADYASNNAFYTAIYFMPR